MQLNYILQNGLSLHSSSSPSSSFVKHAGKIRCEITVSKRYSSDLEQGGLEIPAKIIFQNSNERIIEEMKKKLAPLIEEYNKKQLLYVRVIRFFKKISFIKFFFFFSQIRCALKLGALKIELLTRCALHNQSQILFETGCALNQDNYGSYISQTFQQLVTYAKISFCFLNKIFYL